MTRPLELEPVIRAVPRWYGDKTLLVDSLALTVALLGIGTDSGAVFVFGFAGYLLGAPLVHVGHGNGGRAGCSLGLRGVLPILSSALTAAGADCTYARDIEPGDERDFLCGFSEALTGLAIGSLAAIVIDAAIIARDTIYEPVRVQPVGVLRPNGFWLGVRGAL